MGLESIRFQQKLVPGNFLEVNCGRHVRLTSPLCGNCLENVGASTSHNPEGLLSLLQDTSTFITIMSIGVVFVGVVELWGLSPPADYPDRVTAACRRN
jgi:hypothetical protein